MDKPDFTLALLTKQSPKEVFEAIQHVGTWWTGWYASNIYDMYINFWAKYSVSLIVNDIEISRRPLEYEKNNRI